MAVRVLLATDVLDSTRLAEQLGDVQVARLWSTHDRAARKLLRAWRGREIDRTDGFLMLFESVDDAVGFALAYHELLDGLGIQARAGIHRGELVLIVNNAQDIAYGAKPLEVEGLTKPLTARVMSIARGGQTLLSGQAFRGLEGARETAAHGHWRLKGVADPVEIHEALRPGVPIPPPEDQAKAWRVVEEGGVWMPVREIPRFLPADRDAFVGRAVELDALRRELDTGARLVVLTGPGGVGKTRMCLRFGAQWLGEWPGGVWFCDLAEARTLDGIAFAVGRAMGVEVGASDPIRVLGHAIASRGDCLVILDNFEQIAGWASASVGAWLDRAEKARFLVTSREILGIPGEVALSLDALSEEEAIDLFLTRAHQARPDLVVAPGDLPVIGQLVDRLDRLPLAIELAAARVRMLSPWALNERLDERFRLLAGGGGRPGRQATLRATLDWSWNLLEPDERAALAQLSVFEGGFTLDAAQDVLELAATWIPDAVQALIDKSLVRPLGEGGASARYGMLVSVHEYAAEKLDDRAAVEARHGERFARAGRPERLAELSTKDGVRLRKFLFAELDNLVIACQRAVAREDVSVAVATLDAAAVVLEMHGPSASLYALAQAVAELPLDEGSRARVTRQVVSALWVTERRTRAKTVVGEALAKARARRDRPTEAWALSRLGRLFVEDRQFQLARRPLEQALPLYRELGDRPGEALALGELALLREHVGVPEDARALFEEALAIDRALGDRRAEANHLSNLGMLVGDGGDLEGARDLLLQGLAIHREVGNRRNEGVVLSALGGFMKRAGRLADAIGYYEQAIAIHSAIGHRRSEGISLANLGILHQGSGDLRRAVPLLRAGLAAHRDSGNRYSECVTLGALSDAMAALEDADEAIRLARACLSLAREHGFEDYVVASEQTLAKLGAG